MNLWQSVQTKGAVFITRIRDVNREVFEHESVFTLPCTASCEGLNSLCIRIEKYVQVPFEEITYIIHHSYTSDSGKGESSI